MDLGIRYNQVFLDRQLVNAIYNIFHGHITHMFMVIRRSFTRLTEYLSITSKYVFMII